MLLPIFLILFATATAAVAVYGTLPQWILSQHGLEIIEWSRRLEWPLLTISLLLCFVLGVLVVIGKKRAWWLIGYAPIIALLLQHFVTGNMSRLRVIEQPPMVSVKDAARFMSPDEYVVGLVFNDQPCAFPYRQIYNAPAILAQSREKRMVLLWSAFANRAMACNVTRQIKGRELDIVSMPGNAMLVYNGRVGEFINAVTGLTPEGKLPNGFGARLPTIKTTWAQWKAWHPNTLVSALPTFSTGAAVPIMPQYPMPVTPTLAKPVETPILFFATTRPVAIEEDSIRTTFLNTNLDGKPVLLYRDPGTGRVRAYGREFAGYISRFVPNPSTRRAAKGVVMIDVDTNSGWNASGVAVDGENPELVGQKLEVINAFEDGLYYGVMKQWYPELELVQP